MNLPFLAGADAFVYDSTDRSFRAVDDDTGGDRILASGMGVRPAISPDGAWVAYDDDDRLMLLNVAVPASSVEIAPTASWHFIEWSPDGAHFVARYASPSGLGTVFFRTPPPEKTRLTSSPIGPVEHATFSGWLPDGSGALLVTDVCQPQPDGFGLAIFDFATESIRTLWNDAGMVPWTREVSPDGSRLAVSPGASETDVVIVDIASGERLHAPRLQDFQELQYVHWHGNDLLLVSPLGSGEWCMSWYD